MMQLPATSATLNAEVIDKALPLLPLAMDSAKARVMLIAIARQESGIAHRWQVVDRSQPSVKGPARGLWQFERGGGVKGVMEHHATAGHAHRVCADRGVPWDRAAIWEAFEVDDILAACFARLLLYSDPKPLPELGDANGGWDLYARTWRPGKPHHEFWPGNHQYARAALGV